MKWLSIGVSCVLTAVSAMALGPVARAAIETGDAIHVSRNTSPASAPGEYDADSKTQHPSGFPGGEFWVQKIDSPGTSPSAEDTTHSLASPAHVAGESATGTSYSDSAKVFCIEYNEGIYLNGNYWVTVEPFAIAGGISGGTYTPNYDASSSPSFPGNDSYDPSGSNPGGDPLSDATRWLYGTYATSDLDGTYTSGSNSYTYAYDDPASGAALQRALWYLEGEGSAAVGSFERALADAAIAAADATSFLGVKVMNLWTTRTETSPGSGQYVYSGLAQSQVFMEPGDIAIPEPMSLVVWGGMGAFGLVMVRRRKSHASKS